MVKGENRGHMEKESMEGGRCKPESGFPSNVNFQESSWFWSAPITLFSSAFRNQLACFIFSLLSSVVSTSFSPSLIFAEQIILLYLLPCICVSEKSAW